MPKNQGYAFGANVSQRIKKTLLFHNVLMQSIKNKYQSITSTKERHVFSKLMLFGANVSQRIKKT